MSEIAAWSVFLDELDRLREERIKRETERILALPEAERRAELQRLMLDDLLRMP